MSLLFYFCLQPGTGDPLLNQGHQCQAIMIWNYEQRMFEGPLGNIRNGSIPINDGILAIWPARINRN